MKGRTLEPKQMCCEEYLLFSGSSGKLKTPKRFHATSMKLDACLASAVGSHEVTAEEDKLFTVQAELEDQRSSAVSSVASDAPNVFDVR